MEFSRARTKEQIVQRQADVMNACDTLFEQGGYDNVNIKAISEMTTITRSSIYTYYKTKDEIILDLLRIELLSWNEQILNWTKKKAPMNKLCFCRDFTSLLLKNEKMLKHYSLLYSFLEINCRIEKLIVFKKEVFPVTVTIASILKMNFPELTTEQASIITEEFMAYILGLYPATHLTKKQKDAMKQSLADYPEVNFSQMCMSGLFAFINSYVN